VGGGGGGGSYLGGGGGEALGAAYIHRNEVCIPGGRRGFGSLRRTKMRCSLLLKNMGKGPEAFKEGNGGSASPHCKPSRSVKDLLRKRN